MADFDLHSAHINVVINSLQILYCSYPRWSIVPKCNMQNRARCWHVLQLITLVIWEIPNNYIRTIFIQYFVIIQYILNIYTSLKVSLNVHYTIYIAHEHEHEHEKQPCKSNWRYSMQTFSSNLLLKIYNMGHQKR